MSLIKKTYVYLYLHWQLYRLQPEGNYQLFFESDGIRLVYYGLFFVLPYKWAGAMNCRLKTKFYNSCFEATFK